jgi:uncharacterized protein
VEVETAYGPARVHLQPVANPRGMVVLGHGAGGGVAAPDLLGAASAARAAGFEVALVEQPYRVAGRRSPAPARQLDAAWLAVIARLRERAGGVGPLVAGGRSSGARVACRTSREADAAAVICLAFPLHPPGRGDDPTKSRLGELEDVTVPTLIVQGERDPFGMPPGAANRRVTVVPGDHALRHSRAVQAAVADWLTGRGRAQRA